MVTEANYADVVEEVIKELMDVRDTFVSAGVAPEKLILDPGLGFAKDAEHNWELLRALDRFTALGHRVLVGTSRKRFLGAEDVDRDAATAAVTTYSALHEAWAVRVHEVPGSVAAVRVAGALRAR